MVHGDRVALALDSAALVPALHGCLLLGAVAVPIDLRLNPAERAVRQASARLVLERPLAGEPIERPYAPEPSEIATLMFTSGTTAGPKPVELSYDNWLWNALGSALALGLDPDERWLCPMPLAHVGGLSIQLRSAIYGTTVVLHDRFETGRALAALMDAGARVTIVSLVPTMLARLLDAGLRQPPTLRRVLPGRRPDIFFAARARRAGRRSGLALVRDDRDVLAGGHRRLRAAGCRAAGRRRPGAARARAGGVGERAVRRWLAAHRRPGRARRPRPAGDHRAQEPTRS